MTEIVWHPVDETPPRAEDYRIRGTLERGGSRVHCQRARWHPRGRYWSDADGYEILGVTHWAEIGYPEPPWGTIVYPPPPEEA